MVWYLSGWERCRIKCPVMKPDPPVAPGGQLIPKDPPEVWDSELWEGESIAYFCENETLVIDHTKGYLELRYKCLADGTYDAPGPGERWPECTEAPIDPCKSILSLLLRSNQIIALMFFISPDIIEAIILMTGGSMYSCTSCLFCSTWYCLKYLSIKQYFPCI